MTALTPTRSSPRPLLGPWLASRSGWIGIDIGTVATKLAQVERAGQGFRLAAHWIIDNQGAEPLSKSTLLASGSLPFKSQLAQVRSVFRGRRAAASLPLSLMEVRSIELPAGTDEELRNMMHEELLADAAETIELCFDYLATQAADSAEGDMGTYSLFAAPTGVATSTANSLRQAGFECEVLDSLPCALARATQLCEPAEYQTPLAALDFGYASALLVVAKGGQLLFTRQLRGCGLQMLLKPVQQRLQLTDDEAKQLLSRYAVPSTSDSSPLAALAKTAQAIMAEPLAHVATELKRTFDFLDLQFRSITPKKLILVGGGALLPALPSTLAEETGLPTRLWSMPPENGQAARPEEAMFGVAAALSSLAWEAAACT